MHSVSTHDYSSAGKLLYAALQFSLQARRKLRLNKIVSEAKVSLKALAVSGTLNFVEHNLQYSPQYVTSWSLFNESPFVQRKIRLSGTQ